METNEEKINLTSNVILSMILICLYLLGVYFHTKIIKVSIKEKDITWKLDITNSVLLLVSGMHTIFMHIITTFVDNLFTFSLPLVLMPIKERAQALCQNLPVKLW